MDDFDHHPFTNERAGIVLEIAFDEAPDPIDLEVGNRGNLAVEGNDVDHTGALQDRHPFATVEARETVAGKQGPIDLLLAILPAAPLRDRRQEGFEPFTFELFSDDLLVARSRPDRVPRVTDWSLRRHSLIARLDQRSLRPQFAFRTPSSAH